MLSQYATIIHELALLSFSLAFLFMGLLTIGGVLWGGLSLYKWALGGGVSALGTALKRGLFSVEGRSGVLSYTDEDSYRIDREMEQEERRGR